MQVRVGSTGRAFLHRLTTRTDGLAVVFFPLTVCKVCGKEYVARTKLHNLNCQRMFELAAQPAQASRQRLADRWLDEWRSFSFVLVVRLADPSMLSWQAVVGPPRALPLRRYWLWVKASPEFPLWRYCQYLVWLHQRLNTLCVVDSSIPLARSSANCSNYRRAILQERNMAA